MVDPIRPTEVTPSSLVVLVSVLFRGHGRAAKTSASWRNGKFAAVPSQMLEVSNVVAYLGLEFNYESIQLSFVDPSARLIGVVDDHNTYTSESSNTSIDLVSAVGSRAEYVIMYDDVTNCKSRQPERTGSMCSV
jgi:hypothetical protein